MLQAAPPGYASRIPVTSAHEVLARAAQCGTPLGIRVGEGHVTHTQVGQVRQVGLEGRWLRARHDDWRLQLCEDRIAQAWLVQQPTRMGLLHSVDCLDAHGHLLVRLQGARRGCGAEHCEWRALLTSLLPTAPVAAQHRTARDCR